MKNIKAGDKVRIKNGCTKYGKKYNGETGIIAKLYMRTDGAYGNTPISLTNQHNKNSTYGYFYFRVDDFDVIAEEVDTTSEIFPNLTECQQDLLDSITQSNCFKEITYSHKLKGEKEMKSEKIISLWRDNQEDAILNNIDTKEDKILTLDPLYSSVKKHVDEIDKILSGQGFNKMSDEIHFKSYALNTTDALLSQNKAYGAKLQKDLDKRYIEICAMLSACDTYEQEMEVLKSYKIVGEDGKLVVVH